MVVLQWKRNPYYQSFCGMREFHCKQHCLFECYQQDFLLYERVLSDKNEIYSLHEPQVYCVAKGKDHKQYEYGSKASIASTAQGNIIVVVVSHEQNLHDSHTLPEILCHIENSRGKAAKQAVCDPINLLMAAAAWNMKQWLPSHFLVLFPVEKDANLSDSVMEI